MVDIWVLLVLQFKYIDGKTASEMSDSKTGKIKVEVWNLDRASDTKTECDDTGLLLWDLISLCLCMLWLMQVSALPSCRRDSQLNDDCLTSDPLLTRWTKQEVQKEERTIDQGNVRPNKWKTP